MVDGAPRVTATGAAKSTEDDLMTGNFKIFGNAEWGSKAIESGIHDINNGLAPQTNQMVMGSQVGIKSSTGMANVDFMNQPGGTQDSKCVVDGVQRHHRKLRSDFGKELLRCRMGGAAEECIINCCSLRSRFQSASLKLLLDVIKGNFHIIPV